MSDALKPQYKE